MQNKPWLNLFLCMSLAGIFGCSEEMVSPASYDQPVVEQGEADKQISDLAKKCPDYPTNYSFHEIKDPLAEQNQAFRLQDQESPEVGDCWMEPQLGTIIRRVTSIDGINGRHEYSRIDAFNADHSMVLLITDEGTQKVYRTNILPYNQPGNLVMEISATEPRWDPQDPHRIWAINAFQIVTIDVEKGMVEVIKDFAKDEILKPILSRISAYRVTSMDEGETSLDKRYWALAIQGNEDEDYRYLRLFVWDKENDAILGIYPDNRSLKRTESELDWIGMSPLGNWVVIGAMDTNQGEITGLTLADKGLRQFHRLDFTTAHADTGLDCKGNEVIIMQSTQTDTIDMIPLSMSSQPVTEPGGSEEGTGRTPLVRLYYDSNSPNGLNSGVHISCNSPCYCVISTTIAPGLPEQNWLDRSLILVKLIPDHPRAFYLAKLHNTTSEEPRVYWDETQASITSDGSKIIWADNWGKHVGQDEIFLLEMLMPDRWQERIVE